jgi:hypothetical protein
MLYTQSPAAKFILYSYQKGSSFVDALLWEKIENLIDLIKFRTKTKGTEYTSLSLHNELFDVRIELLSFLLTEPGVLKEIENLIAGEIAEKYYLEGTYKKLGHTVADSLEVYLKIFSHFSETVSDYLTGNKLFSRSDMPSLNGLKLLLSLQAPKEFENYIQWIEASLNFDCALIIADLALKKELDLKVSEIVQLESFLKKSIVNFGAYSAVTNFWHPEIDDEAQLIRNIKIKTAVIEVENGTSHKYTGKKLLEFINN